MIRKIMSKEEIERKDKRNKTIMGIILAVIMLLSTAGYFVMDFSSQKANSVKYNNVEFKETDGYWTFTLNGQSFSTLYNPLDTQNISVSVINTLYSYSNQPLYFSSKPIEEMPSYASQEILRNIGSFTLRNNYACLDENCSQDYAVKDCSNDNIIVYQESNDNQTKIYQENKCVTIAYAPGEAERASDAMLFKILGI
jgi:hypothetical protein